MSDKDLYFAIDEEPDDYILHYGMPRRSGRYPWGSGDNPYQHEGDFLSRVKELKDQGLSEKEIADALGMSTTELRVQKSIANDERRAVLAQQAKDLQAKGYNTYQIAEKMGFKNESSVRNLLNNESAKRRMNAAKTTADFLREQIEKKGMLDVGKGVEKELGITKTQLDEALTILSMEGYPIFKAGIPQATNPGKQSNMTVIAPKDTEYDIKVNPKTGEEYISNPEVYNFENVHSVRDYISHDGGETFDPKWVYPKSLDSKRLSINYAEDGGDQKDGVIEIRRGVDDLSLGASHYAQVRILVDGTHYLKGMAVYSDDLPDGVDIRFNTNKKRGTPQTEVLKKIKDDPDNPFGSLIKEGINDPDKGDDFKGGQSYYYDKDGKKQLSLINKRAEEGDWEDWSKKLPSQFLAKQPLSLAKKQLKLAEVDKELEFAQINELTNPTLKANLLYSFADDCDAASVHLKAAALPRQRYQVILPLNTVKDNEIYAPNFKNGEEVALIRFPHAGLFEIPILKVNNKLDEGNSVITKNAKDAVGISKKVADQLSGADFDGDTVLVIPTGSSKINIKSAPRLRALEGFDTKIEYGPDSSEPVKVIKNEKGKVIKEYYTRDGKTYSRMSDTQKQMGVISNLITDMTLKGADDKELARAVKHSMVVIDAEKHKLDYKQSELDNDIASLKKKYQGHIGDDGRYHEGASTLISRAKGEATVDKRQGSPTINIKGTEKYDPSRPEGVKIYKTATDLYYTDKKTGKTMRRTQKSTAMAETDDARTLSTGKPMEELYADYANKMKSLANRARKEAATIKNIPYSPSANKTYKNEVYSLDAKLNNAMKNAPREREAQRIANSVVSAKKQADRDLTKAEIKKLNQQAITQARVKTGAKRDPIKVTDKEWEAIQAGAISATKLSNILTYADKDELRQRATPRNSSPAVTQTKINKMKAMRNSDYTNAEIAEALGVSVSTVVKYLG